MCIRDRNNAQLVIDEVKKAVKGKDDCIIKAFAAFLAGGHILLEDEMCIRDSIEVLKENKDTRWRVSGDEDWQNKHYDNCMHVFDRYLNDTNSPADPWYTFLCKE